MVAVWQSKILSINWSRYSRCTFYSLMTDWVEIWTANISCSISRWCCTVLYTTFEKARSISSFVKPFFSKNAFRWANGLSRSLYTRTKISRRFKHSISFAARYVSLFSFASDREKFPVNFVLLINQLNGMKLTSVLSVQGTRFMIDGSGFDEPGKRHMRQALTNSWAVMLASVPNTLPMYMWPIAQP